MPYKDPIKARGYNRKFRARWRLLHPDLEQKARVKNSKRIKQLRKQNPWTYRMYDMLKYLIDPEHVRDRNRQSYRRHIEKRRADDRARYKRRRNNGDFRKANRKCHAKRKAAILGAAIRDLPAITRIYERAEQWRQWGFNVVVDHIIPLAKGGEHAPENLQILYRNENNEKNAQLDYSPSVVFV